MYNSQIIDFYNDTSKQLFYKIDKNYTTPEFVKQASTETADEIVGLPSEYFADRARHKLPCHNKSATWLSNAYFLENYDNYEPRERTIVQNNLIKKAKQFGIEKEVSAIFIKKASTIEKNDNMKYALIIKEEGKTTKCFPTNTAEAITKSASTLFNNKHRYTWQMRKEASQKLVQAADGYKVKLKPEIEAYLTKSSGYGVSLPSTISAAIGKRVYMVKNASSDQTCIDLAKIALAFKHESNLTLPNLEKLATAIEAFDVLHNLTRYYGKIATPEEICFDMSMQKMSSYVDDHIELKDGTIIKTADVTAIDINDLKNVMGEKIASAFAPGGVYDNAEIETILPSLPLGDLAVFKSLLKG